MELVFPLHFHRGGRLGLHGTGSFSFSPCAGIPSAGINGISGTYCPPPGMVCWRHNTEQKGRPRVLLPTLSSSLPLESTSLTQQARRCLLSRQVERTSLLPFTHLAIMGFRYCLKERGTSVSRAYGEHPTPAGSQ